MLDHRSPVEFLLIVADPLPWRPDTLQEHVAAQLRVDSLPPSFQLGNRVLQFDAIDTQLLMLFPVPLNRLELLAQLLVPAEQVGQFAGLSAWLQESAAFHFDLARHFQ